jgi:uncharacterized protein
MFSLFSQSSLSPTLTTERISIIDIIRGFALLGILIVNMYSFSHPIEEPLFAFDPKMSVIDQTTTWCILFFAEGKFYPIFSILFGWGLTLQMQRLMTKGQSFIAFYCRRLILLLIIGLFHAYFIWVGDILSLYAVLGFVLICYRHAQPKTLLIWVGVWLAISLFIYLWLIFSFRNDSIQVVKPTIEEQQLINAATAPTNSAVLTIEPKANEPAILEPIYQLYAQGSFAEIVAQRAREIYSMVIWADMIGSPEILAFFLLGIYFGRRQLFRQLNNNLTLVYQLFGWGWGLGVVSNFIYATWSITLDQYEPFPLALVVLIAQSVGSVALSLGYIATIMLLNRQPYWQFFFRWLSPVGQMALTNYLTQSLICTLIFYGYGFGLFGQISITEGVVLAGVIYLVQVIWSTWWLQRFYFGPMEWLWRSGVYMKWQPFYRH